MTRSDNLTDAGPVPAWVFRPDVPPPDPLTVGQGEQRIEWPTSVEWIGVRPEPRRVPLAWLPAAFLLGAACALVAVWRLL